MTELKLRQLNKLLDRDRILKEIVLKGESQLKEEKGIIILREYYPLCWLFHSMAHYSTHFGDLISVTMIKVLLGSNSISA